MQIINKCSLSLLCVGSGRDGTKTVATLIQSILASEALDRSVHHEYGSREFYQNYSNFCETGDQCYLDGIDKLIDECPHAAIVGNGYASILDRFAKRTAHLKLLHIQRRSEADCIKSLCQDAEDFPEGYRYYISDFPTYMKRMAAFHFREMLRDEWEGLPLEKKFVWYYHKTHFLISQYAGLFPQYQKIYTEDLSDFETRKLIRDFVSDAGGVIPESVHINRGLPRISGLGKSERAVLQWLARNLGIHKMQHDPGYFMNTITACMKRWECYLSNDINIEELYWMRRFPPEEMNNVFNRFNNLLMQGEKGKESLRKMLMEGIIE